jgi:hypothetical protein
LVDHATVNNALNIETIHSINNFILQAYRPCWHPDRKRLMDTGLLRARHLTGQADAIGKMMEGGHDVFKVLFSETGTCEHVLPVVFMGLEPTVVDEVGAGAYCALFHPAKQTMINHSDCRFMVDSAALDIEGWTFTNLSGLMGWVTSSLPASLRFDGAINVEFIAFHANGVRCARVQCSICHLCASDQGGEGVPLTLSVAQINKALIAPPKISEVPPAARKLHGGHAVGPRRSHPEEHRRGIGMIKSKTTIKFIDWFPAGFKICMSYQRPAVVPGGDLAKFQCTVCMVANATVIAEGWSGLDEKLKLMYAKCAFVHWYVGEGTKEANGSFVIVFHWQSVKSVGA